MNQFNVRICCSFLVAMGMWAGSSNASIVFQTPGGSTTGDGAVAGQATFSLSLGQLTLTLVDNQQNIISDGQAISGITFTLGSAAGSGSLSMINSGTIATVSSGGAYTTGAADSLTRWQASESASTVHLTTLTGGKPNRLIIGPDDHGGFNPAVGKFSNANASVIQHNPVELGTATFIISIPGITANSIISDVSMIFGTTDYATDHTVPLTVIPEPTTMIAGALLLLPFGLSSLRALRRNRIG
jgi:hypothetical protein